MSWRSFAAGFAAACVLLAGIWIGTGGRNSVLVQSHSRALKVDRLTGKTYLLKHDQWNEIITAGQ